jgi:hypothetical protein
MIASMSGLNVMSILFLLPILFPHFRPSMIMVWKGQLAILVVSCPYLSRKRDIRCVNDRDPLTISKSFPVFKKRNVSFFFFHYFPHLLIN